MHTFGIDNDFRLKIIAGIAIASFISLPVLNSTLIPLINSYLLYGITIPSFITVSVMFTILFEIYNRYIWRWPVIHSQLVAVPDLNGHWKGHIWTNYSGEIDEDLIAAAENDAEGDHTPLAAELHIDQTWRKISIHFKTERSSSDSTGASFHTSKFRHPRLAYQFQNEGPDPRRLNEDEGPYSGAAEFKYILSDEGPDTLEGFYFTGPSRGNNSGAAAFKRD